MLPQELSLQIGESAAITPGDFYSVCPGMVTVTFLTVKDDEELLQVYLCSDSELIHPDSCSPCSCTVCCGWGRPAACTR